MAKIRNLKKYIEYLSEELMTETMLCSLQPNADNVELEKLLSKICEINDEFISRAQHPNGNANKQIVKQYYKKLYEDFNGEVNKIYAELMMLNKDRATN